MNNLTKTKSFVLAGFMLALTLVLPFLTGQIPQIGSMLAPMHLPVLLCAYICGWQYAAAIGFIAPVLRFIIFGMPPLFPVGIAMTFELATYGLIAGLLYVMLKNKKGGIYISLIGAMIAGRIVWGIVMYIISAVSLVEFNLSIFMAGAFINAVPGIIVQLILIPAIVYALKRTKFRLAC